MPKLGMEPKRRAAFVSAAIDEIGEARSLDVSVAQIARRAGMSSALAHHYFGGKDHMLVAAMRHILTEFAGKVREALAGAHTPRQRLEALVGANFAEHVFDRRKTSAWLSFYGLAQSNSEAARLMRLYQARLHSNLLFDLRKLTPQPDIAARALAAQIDGAYLRAALAGETSGKPVVADVIATLDAYLGDVK